MFRQLIPQHCDLSDVCYGFHIVCWPLKHLLFINLDQVITILGEWSGETAAGNDIKTKFKNPCYLLTVPSRGKYHEEIFRYIGKKVMHVT